MGTAIGTALSTAGHEVLWVSAGRSEATRARAGGFADVGTTAELCSRAEVIFSVVPPHASLEVAESLPPFAGIYVDANAIAPTTAVRVGATVARFVDGGIIGGPPDPHIYLSGDEAAAVAALFADSPIEARAVADASALKCAYAGWTKGSAALLLAIRAYAQATGVWEALAAEWPPELHETLAAAERSSAKKGWRWIGEMEEIAGALAAADLPPGFHAAAAEVYRGPSS